MSVDVTAVEALGYTVEVTGNDGEFEFPYLVRGKRGAEYGLMRVVPNPQQLFSVNARNWTRSAKVGGYEWFTDKDGCLRPLR